jgi:hypothetical protein
MRGTKLVWTFVPMLILALLAGAWALERGLYRVGPSVENFRSEPGGSKLGTLLQGTQIERISQDGKWVRFRVEGWVWGPSLEGFEPAKETREDGEPELEPRLPLQDATPRIRRLVEERQGSFYSITLDADLQRLTLRLRVRNLEPEALHGQQMRLQRELLAMLGDEVEFSSIRVESNRPDGSGTVGLEIAETRIQELERTAGADVEAWQAASRISHDGGQTWSDDD